MPLRKVLKSLARPASLEVQCTHITMTRVYGPTHLCSACRRPGPFGWVYQCTQDKEGIIDDALAQGDLVSPAFATPQRAQLMLIHTLF